MQKRLLSTSLAHLQSYSRTILNPKNYQLNVPLKFAPKSVVLLSTQSNLNQVIEESIRINQLHQIQVVVAGIDTVVPNSHPNGVSELWNDQKAAVNESVLLEERDDLNNEPKESDGLNVVSARKNWKIIKSMFNMDLGDAKVEMNVGNSLFSTGNLVTLFFLDDKNVHSGQTLCELSISVPITTSDIQFVDKLTPLYDERFVITEFIGNIIKSIDYKSASGYLQDNEKLMSIGSKDTEVYAKIYPKNGAGFFKYQIIAGGGGWGTKASRIVLSTDARIDNGDGIEFFMLTPEDKIKRDDAVDVSKEQFIFESSYHEDTYTSGETGAAPETTLEGVFGCGSEDGFALNGVNCVSAGERVVIQ